jgi:CRISPR system Cascade subunit CasD
VNTLLLCCQAPWQSWGTEDRFVVRGTGREPSYSGIIGMIAAAQGRAYDAPVDDLTEALTMGVREDRPGEIDRDYHTVRGGRRGTGRPDDIALTERDYLADAIYLVALGGPDAVLRQVMAALERPATFLALGRRCCAPSTPLLMRDSLRPGEIEPELCTYPWLGREGEERPQRLRLRLPADTSNATTTRMDYPLAYAQGHWAYGPRSLRADWIRTPEG